MIPSKTSRVRRAKALKANDTTPLSSRSMPKDLACGTPSRAVGNLRRDSTRLRSSGSWFAGNCPGTVNKGKQECRHLATVGLHQEGIWTAIQSARNQYLQKLDAMR